MSILAKIWPREQKMEQETNSVCNHDFCVSKKEFEDFKSKIMIKVGNKLARLEQRQKKTEMKNDENKQSE